MTVTVTDLEAGPFTATGASQTVAFAYKVFSASEIEVVDADGEPLLTDADFSVASNTNPGGAVTEGGTVTIEAAALDAGTEFYLVAKPYEGQDQVFSSAGTRLENLNEGLDRVSLQVLRQRRDLERGLTGAAGAATTAIAAREGAEAALAAAEALAVAGANIQIAGVGDGGVPQTIAQILNAAPVSVFRYGAVGDGVADDTEALQACYDANPGAVIDHGNGKTFLVSSAVLLRDGGTYLGASEIKAKADTTFPIDGPGALFRGDGVDDVTVRGLTFNGNAAHPNGARYGVFLGLGSRNRVEGAYIHDTLEAGIRLDSESGTKIIGNSLIDCGRGGLGYTGDHGIMMVSLNATPLENIVVANNVVVNAARKGITTYSTEEGVVREIAITGNTVSGCGLGGIYTGSGDNDFDQKGITVAGNTCFDNYANIVINCATGVAVTGNTCRDDSGGGGIEINDAEEFSVVGNLVSDASVHGIQCLAGTGVCQNGVITGNVVLRSNTISAGFGCGILLEASSSIVVEGNLVRDTAAKMTQGIAENGASDNNVIGSGNRVTGATSANFLIVGASTRHQTPEEKTVALVNGQNDDVAIPAGARFITFAGPNAAYSITGLAGGYPGRRLTILNYAPDATFVNQSGGSLEDNRFYLSANRVIAGLDGVELIYSAVAGGWIISGS